MPITDIALPRRPRRDDLAALLLILFAFAAWNLTGLANVALALLVLLLILDLPGQWTRLRRDPGIWLLVLGAVLTIALAWRAAIELPQTAEQQWSAVSGWLRPLLFVVIAWWLREDRRRVGWVLIAATLGLLVGVLRRADGADVAAILALLQGQVGFGARGDFGQAALALGFIASIALLGLFIFHREILNPRIAPRPPPILMGALWIGALLFFLIVLLVTQARGATLTLALVVVALLIHRAGRGGAERTSRRGHPARAPLIGLLTAAAIAGVLWSSSDRITTDLAALTQASEAGHYSYDSSIGTRLNLYRIGADLIAERPLLGWGPGTSGTRDLVPAGVIALSEHDRVNVPQWAHLHSTPVEILVRFGALGLVFALLFVLLMARHLWIIQRRGDLDPALRRFLILGTLMTCLYSLYDFRLANLDIGLFFVLFFGILHALGMSRGDADPPGDKR